MQSRFVLVIVIGYGKTAGDVLRYVAQRQSVFGFRTLCVEHELHGMSQLRAVCEKMGVDYELIIDKSKLTELLLAVKESTLIISAGNNYLFPKALVEQPNLEIINFHSALLPKFPGRNAQSWAIYEGEKATGATWHYVTAGVDSGAIIAQRETPITADIKACELTRDIMVAAYEVFQDFFDELLVQHIKGRPQMLPESERKMYYSWEIPGDGMCSLDDAPEDIYRMLRAMDYGKSDIFPPARIRLACGRVVEVLRYAKASGSHLKGGEKISVDEKSQRIYLTMDDTTELIIKYKEINNN